MAERSMAFDLPTIRGNHERQILDQQRAARGASDSYAAQQIFVPYDCESAAQLAAARGRLDWATALRNGFL